MMLMREMKMRAHPRRDVSLVIAGTGMSRSPGCLCVVMMNPQITNLHTVLYRYCTGTRPSYRANGVRF